MKILALIILTLGLTACASDKKPQSESNYQIKPIPVAKATEPVKEKSPVPMVQKAKKDPRPQNYYPVPHTVMY